MKTTKKSATSSKAKRPDRSQKTIKPTKAAVPARAKASKRDSSVAPKAALPQSDMAKKETRVEIKPAKGRPMLTWVGKKPLRHAIAYPAQLVESFSLTPSPSPRGRGEQWTDWPKDMPQTGLLFHGDNKDVLAYLLANGFRGKVKLIYIDPPFDSGADYVRKVNLRGEKFLVEGESYGIGEQIQYTDIWANDNYLQFMYERLLLLKELLTENGAIYLHCDDRKNSYLRCLLDEIFGAENFKNEIVWKRTTARSGSSTYNHIHDTILFYTKGSDFIWNQQHLPYSKEYLETNFRLDKAGRLFRETPLTAPGTRTGYSGQSWKGVNPSTIGKGRHWAIPGFVNHLITKEAQSNTLIALDELEKMGRIVWAKDGEGRPNIIQYADEMQGVELQSLWLEFGAISGSGEESEEYPTQKPRALIERIIEGSSNANDIILDCFLGSGTTAAVAQKMGRRWIGADINKGAIQTTTKRLQGDIQEQIESAKAKPQTLPGMENQKTPTPAQLGFAMYRVNDYDLQIQHNEAFNLAVEHLGMTRTKTDAFFDGTLGRKLVKIVPFNHPVTPLDLEEVKRELKNRSEEERDIAIVGLGKEVAVEVWLDEWNKLRKQGNVPNKIEVIELRSDPKYGGFFTHEPAKAKVTFKREKENVEITIDDFISPTILERLHQQNKDNPLFKPQVSDWKSMVDSVMIDSAYDGKVFNITLADVPEKKNDLVDGKYVVEAKKGAMVAVKVTDMLGEEVLVVKGM